MRAVLYLNGVRGPDLDDAAQDVQLRLLERAPTNLENPGAWSCTVATRVALDLHRRRATRRRLFSVLSRNASEQGALPEQATVIAVREALKQLDVDLRAVVVLRYFADLDVRTIAQALDVPEGTVKSRLHRAAARLRTALSEEDACEIN